MHDLRFPPPNLVLVKLEYFFYIFFFFFNQFVVQMVFLQYGIPVTPGIPILKVRYNLDYAQSEIYKNQCYFAY